MNGSLSYGMYTPEEKSDIDLRFFGNVTGLHQFAKSYSSRTALESCLGLLLSAKLKETVTSHLIGCSLDVSTVRCELETNDDYLDLVDLHGYAMLELRLDTFADKYLAAVEEKRKANPEFDQALQSDSVLMICSQWQSFEKYNKRLRRRGIEVPEHVHELILEIGC